MIGKNYLDKSEIPCINSLNLYINITITSDETLDHRTAF